MHPLKSQGKFIFPKLRGAAGTDLKKLDWIFECIESPVVSNIYYPLKNHMENIMGNPRVGNVWPSFLRRWRIGEVPFFP